MAVTNEKEFKAWLEDQPREVAIAMAYREVMRSLPQSLSSLVGTTDLSNVSLLCVRLLLLAAVGQRRDLRSLGVVRPVLYAAWKAGDWDGERGVIPGAVAIGVFMRKVSVLAALAVADDETLARIPNEFARGFSGLAPSKTAMSAETSDYGLSEALSEIVKASAEALSDADRSVEAILNGPIDTATVTPAGAAPVWKDVISGDGPWTFWARWYAAAMAGDPLPWDLQEQIALIPNDIWDAGPEAVAEEIARIEAAYELRQRIAEVEGNQVLSEGQRHGIGGNNPPVEIDDPQTAEQVVVIWESIAGLKEEVEADEPDADRVGRLVDRLAGALSLVMAWCARKADLAVDTTIKWGIPATGGYFILNPAKAEAVLAAAKAWLPFLAP